MAAGRGARMRSGRPKPLHDLCGRAMLLHVLDALISVDPRQIVVVVGYGAEEVAKHVTEEAFDRRIDFVEQPIQRGTADAATRGLAALDNDIDDEDVLLLSADIPLIQGGTLRELVARHRVSGSAATVATAGGNDAEATAGKHGAVATEVTAGKHGAVATAVTAGKHGAVATGVTAGKHGAVATGVTAGKHGAVATGVTAGDNDADVYCFRRSLLSPTLRRVTAGDSGLEYGLGDAVSVLTSAGHPAGSHPIDEVEALGVDDREQLALAEAEMRQRINRNWMVSGVRVVAPHSAYIDVSVKLAPDVVIHPGVVLRGQTMVGEGAIIGPHTHLVDCVVGPRAVVEAVSATDAEIGAEAKVGAYITLEPGARIPPGSTGGS